MMGLCSNPWMRAAMNRDALRVPGGQSFIRDLVSRPTSGFTNHSNLCQCLPKTHAPRPRCRCLRWEVGGMCGKSLVRGQVTRNQPTIRTWPIEASGLLSHIYVTASTVRRKEVTLSQTRSHPISPYSMRLWPARLRMKYEPHLRGGGLSASSRASCSGPA